MHFPILFSALALAQPPSPESNNSAPPKVSPQLAAKAKQIIDANPKSEAGLMASAIIKGSQLGPGEGWFKTPPQKKFDWKWLAALHGVAVDKSITAKAFKEPTDLFDLLDRDGDEELTAADFDWSPSSPFVRQMQMAAALFRPADRNGDGWLTADEWAGAFQRGGGKPMSQEGVRRLLFPKPPKRNGSEKDDGPTPDILLKGLFAGEIGSMKEGPKLGDQAPDFTLKTADGKQTIRLRDCIGSKPVVLVFGNFSCGPFRSWAATLAELAETHKNRATFLGVYVREAHPTGGWRMESNDHSGIAYPQPPDQPTRNAVAGRCAATLKPPYPLLVDTMDDQAGHAYSAMPARLYVIDRSGRVTYKSARGPFGFRPQEMEQALALTLLEAAVSKNSKEAAVKIPTDAEAWKLLPTPISVGGSPLPNWAKAVATQMPRTAAAMLLADHAQRTKSPLDPKLRAKARWVIANANRCEYGMATALGDFRRAGGSEDEVTALQGPSSNWPINERDVLEFARLHTLAAPTIPDALFERLRKQLGDKGVASLVLLGAFGNFQDRVCLGLGLPLEGEGPLPPLAVEFPSQTFQRTPVLPNENPVSAALGQFERVVADDQGWTATSYDELQGRLVRQRERQCRLPVPSWDDVKKRLPADVAAKPTGIVWNLVCSGYVPELAVPWSTSTRTMWTEAAQDRVFEESLFWVQTRAIGCNYCMGHCEMLLEVAGLDKKQVAERTKKLASGDWSSFPPAEQRAFAFAKKLSAEPWMLTAADYKQLESDLGPKKAMAVFWWLCRGLYMTRVSDGFQLPLERDNVFVDFYKPKKN